jgi:hypothetical protein
MLMDFYHISAYKSNMNEKCQTNYVCSYIITHTFIKLQDAADFYLKLADKEVRVLTVVVIQARIKPSDHAVLILSSIWLSRLPVCEVQGRSICPHPCSLQMYSRNIDKSKTKNYKKKQSHNIILFCLLR